jgi:sterol desaturase/sphingolipid hydroxylase (fatty acid hydroxylase superfamily)
MDFAQSWLGGIVGYDVALALTFALLLPLELALPRRGSSVSLRSRLQAVVFWLVWVPVTVAVMLFAGAVWRALDIRPLLGTLTPGFLPRPLGILVGALAAAFVGDFFYYWCHRAQHRFLWRFHAVHHSVRELSSMSAYHHISEEAIKVLLYALPLGLFTDDPLGIPVLGVILGVQGHYLHSTTRLNLGPLGRIIQDNRFHRIHHSMRVEHFDKNFGVFTTLWDSVFGTAHFPAPDEWPPTGLADEPEPQSIADFYFRPFLPKKAGRPAPSTIG